MLTGRETALDQTAIGFLWLGVLVFAAASIWFFVKAARVKWWWPLSFLLILPVFVFVYNNRRELKAPGILLFAAVVFVNAALFVSGDVVIDQHPYEPSGRTFGQRAFGCSGYDVWDKLFTNRKKPLKDWLRTYHFELNALKTESGRAQLAAHAAALSYVSSKEIELMSASFGQNASLTPIAVGEYQAVVIVNEYISLVAFRGTDNPENWVNNFKFLPTQTSFGKVHAGFLEGLRALWPDVLRVLVASRNKNQPIFLVGHSLGGAIALLAAVELQRAMQPVARVITFGQPPVGYATFARYWDKNSHAQLVRYVNHVDAVVEVNIPIALSGAQLTHTGALRYFDTTGQLHTGSPPILQRLRDRVCAACFEKEGPAQFSAHSIRRYLYLVIRVPNG